MIKHIHTDIYAVDVPDGSKLHHVDTTLSGKPYLAHKFRDDELANEYEIIDLPPGQWKYLCLSTTQKEEEAKLVCEVVTGFKSYSKDKKCNPCYKHYDIRGAFEVCATAIKSLSSMNKAFELSGTWALIQKEK
jgi:hypothetical protein